MTGPMQAMSVGETAAPASPEARAAATFEARHWSSHRVGTALLLGFAGLMQLVLLLRLLPALPRLEGRTVAALLWRVFGLVTLIPACLALRHESRPKHWQRDVLVAVTPALLSPAAVVLFQPPPLGVSMGVLLFGLVASAAVLPIKRELLNAVGTLATVAWCVVTAVVRRHELPGNSGLYLVVGAFALIGLNGTVSRLALRSREQLRESLLAQAELEDSEKALKVARDEALEASRAKSRFLTHMSHELRTPMTGVLGMAELLSHGALTDEQREQLAALRDSATSMLGLLDGLLDLSRIEAGRLELTPGPFSLRDPASSTVALFSPLASRKGVTLSLELDETLPRWVRGDAARLRQVLLNLVGNAVKFTTQGSVLLSVKRAASGTERVLFTVRDTGPGLTETQRERLFRPFSQADETVQSRFGGTGLGLAISQSLVGLMGGTIAVQSEPGQGSSFFFELALGACSAPARPTSPGQPTVPAGLRVLVAEDNAVSATLLRTLLTRRGMQVTVTVDGAEALRALDEQGPFDLVLLDMQMPNVDGVEATRRIRARTDAVGKMALVALTADAIAEHRAGYLSAGLDALATKPLQWDELVAAIAQGLRRAKARAAAP